MAQPTIVSTKSGDESRWRAAAVAFLSSKLGERAPAALGPGTIFPESPLEGEGVVAVFPFDMTGGATGPQPCYVAVGETEPNYYPAYQLSPDEAFLLHIGTRFMLVAQVQPASEARLSTFDAAEAARRLVDHVAPGAPVDGLNVAAAFEVAGELHVVCRARVGPEDTYLFAADCPPGFFSRIDLPAPVAYRVHLGRVMVNEAAPDDDQPDQ